MEATTEVHKNGTVRPHEIKPNREDLNKINSLKSQSDIPVAFGKESEDFQVQFKGLEDNDSICSDESDKLPEIPDGGWGWVVVVSAFIVSACADGLAFSFGLLHEEFTAYFDTTQSKTSLIGSLFIATPLLAGPIMSALVDRYGCRIMTMLAGVLSTGGFLLASLSNSVEMLCLTFGFLSGLAMGILYVTAVVSVAFWFDKRRNLAVSLASCGIGFGTLIYSPMTHYFLELYDWRNTIILLAGTLLNMCVCGALMRDPEWLVIKQKRERRLSKTRTRSRISSSAGSISSKSLGGESLFMSAEELKTLLRSGQSPEFILQTLATTIAEAQQLEATTQMNAEQSYKRIHSAINLPTFVQQDEEVPAEVINKIIANKRLYNIILKNYPNVLTRRRSEENLTTNTSETKVNEPATLELTLKILRPKKVSESEGPRTSKIDVTSEPKEKANKELKKTETHTKKTPDPESQNVPNFEITDESNKSNKETKNISHKTERKPKTALESNVTKFEVDVLKSTKETKDISHETEPKQKTALESDATKSKGEVTKATKETKHISQKTEPKSKTALDSDANKSKAEVPKATKDTRNPSNKNPSKPKTTSESKGDLSQATNGTSAKETKPSTTDASILRKADDFLRQISTDHHYFKDMPLYRNTIMHRGAMMNIPRYKLRAASLPNIYKNSMWSLSTMSDGEMGWHERAWQTLKETFDFRMFSELHFLLFNIGSLILSVWFIVPYFFLQSYMTVQGTEGGPTMISVIGVASSVGIVALGWAGDQPWINVTKTYAGCLVICGLSVAAYPHVITNYWALLAVSTVFGLSFASSYSYTPAILMELMPIDHFTVAYGLILLSQGIGHLVGPPLAGMLYDITGTWDASFYAAGAWLCVSGGCIACVAWTKDMRLCGSGPLLKETERDRDVC